MDELIWHDWVDADCMKLMRETRSECRRANASRDKARGWDNDRWKVSWIIVEWEGYVSWEDELIEQMNDEREDREDN